MSLDNSTAKFCLEILLRESSALDFHVKGMKEAKTEKEVKKREAYRKRFDELSGHIQNLEASLASVSTPTFTVMEDGK